MTAQRRRPAPAGRSAAPAAVLVAALFLAACQPKPAPEPAALAGDAAAGQRIAQKTCAACHGSDGNAVAPNIPKLAGQFPEYLQKQLLAFKSGAEGKPRRSSPVMEPIVASLSQADMADVAAYFSSLALSPAKARSPARLVLGRTVFQEGDPDDDLPACVTCHRALGGGIRPDFPRIGGQNPDYVEDELARWQQIRGHRGKLMSIIAPRLKPEERQAVADYIAELRPDGPAAQSASR